MEHPNQIELIEHAGGLLEAARAGDITRHLAECAPCRERFEQVRAVHVLLGDWQVAPPRVDLAEAVAAAARADLGPAARAGRAARPRWAWARPAARAAAAVLMAAAAGHIAGRALRPGPQPPPVARRQVLEAMCLDLLASGSPTGLSDSILYRAQGGPQEARP